MISSTFSDENSYLVFLHELIILIYKSHVHIKYISTQVFSKVM